MAQAIEIGSPPKAGQVKHPVPKCFEKTSFVAGHLVVTSPVVISPVIAGMIFLLSKLLKPRRTERADFESQLLEALTNAIIEH
jgi:hypothetical protein